MDRWHLSVLGKPFAQYGELRIERLPLRCLWGVLASLALDPRSSTRATLAQRFWPDVENRAQSLRNGLSVLRKTFAPELVTSDAPELVTSDLKLAAGTTCDLLEMRSLVKRTKRLPEGTQERLALLEEAALLINGYFLDGCEGDGALDWIKITRIGIAAECLEALELLQKCQRERGDERAAIETIQRILYLDPQNPEAQQALLKSPIPVVRRLSAKLGWAQGAALAGDASEPLCLDDAHTLEGLLKIQLAHLPPALLPTLHALAVFPASFTAEQAQKIGAASEQDLSRFAELEFLHAEADGRYVMRDALRQILWRKLTGEERRRLTEKHAKWFVEWVVETYMRSVIDSSVVVAPLFETEYENLEPVLNRRIAGNPEEIDFSFIGILWLKNDRLKKIVESHKKTLTDWLNQYTSYSNSESIFYILVLHSSVSKETEIASEYLKMISDQKIVPESIRERSFASKISACMLAFHHSGEDRIFDDLVEWGEKVKRQFPKAAAYAPENYFIIGENRMARQRFTEALVFNERLMRCYRSRSHPNFAAALYQRGCILKGLERPDEARACWNEALERFEAKNDQHGIADCLQSLAVLYREEGALVEAKRTVLQAIHLYQKCGDEAAVKTAGGTLGDILLEKGETDKAQTFYEAGLAFWKSRKHPRWTEKFEKRLQNLQERSQFSCKMLP
jgi:tetratricopeptide (TPR) repeat protein